MIVQFGTSRFLQAHVDLFAWEARLAGQTVPDIAIVQTTRDAGRARRLAAFSDPAGFPVIIRGLENAAPVERRLQVRSVTAGLNAARDWRALETLFETSVTHIVCNTGDRGYEVAPEDRRPPADGEPPASFCGILLALLHRRWRAGAQGVIVLPCELVSRNGEALRARLLGLATEQGLDVGFGAWLQSDCVWANTLVDRIVSEPLEPAGAVAEPYALWAIEDQPRLVLPFTHPAITIVGDLEPNERLKLHILNLGHSWLAQRWHDTGAPSQATVRQMLEDPATVAALRRLYADEVIPGFAARGLEAQAQAYVVQTLDRFANPFLNHRLADIFVDHSSKLEKRIGGFLHWVGQAGGSPPMPQLSALAAAAKDLRP